MRPCARYAEIHDCAQQPPEHSVCYHRATHAHSRSRHQFTFPTRAPRRTSRFFCTHSPCTRTAHTRLAYMLASDHVSPCTPSPARRAAACTRRFTQLTRSFPPHHIAPAPLSGDAIWWPCLRRHCRGHHSREPEAQGLCQGLRSGRLPTHGGTGGEGAQQAARRMAGGWCCASGCCVRWWLREMFG